MPKSNSILFFFSFLIGLLKNIKKIYIKKKKKLPTLNNTVITLVSNAPKLLHSNARIVMKLEG